MRRKSPLRPSAPLAAVIALVVTSSGCARLVTLSPREVNASNDVTWRIQKAPLTTEPPAPITPIGEAPIAPRDRPAVQQALRSPPDSLGIPTGLYALDPILVAHRNEMRAEASARNQVATGLVVFGLAFGALSAWGISYGLSERNSVDPITQNSGAQLVTSSSVLALFSVGELAAGMAMFLISPNAAPLTGYYRETYTDGR